MAGGNSSKEINFQKKLKKNIFFDKNNVLSKEFSDIFLNFNYEEMNFIDIYEKIQNIFTFENNIDICSYIIDLSVNQDVCDLPAMCWHPLIANITSIPDVKSDHYIKKENSGLLFVDFEKELSSKEDILKKIGVKGKKIYLSFIEKAAEHKHQHSLFTVENIGEKYRIIEYNTNKKMGTNISFCVNQTLYAKNKDDIVKFLDIILQSSIGFFDFLNKKASHLPIDLHKKLSFLERGHSSVGKYISQGPSGLASILTCQKIVSVSMMDEFLQSSDPQRILHSEDNTQDSSIIDLASKVRLNILGEPTVTQLDNGSQLIAPTPLTVLIDNGVLSSYPVVQGIEPSLPHLTFNQPYKVTAITRALHWEGVSDEDLTLLGKKINALLQSQTLMCSHEEKYYQYQMITKKNLPDDIDLSNSTLGINGVVAKIDIPQYTPLIMKQQYAEKDSDEHKAIMTAIGNYISYSLNLYNKSSNGKFFTDPKESWAQALRSYASYSWDLPTFTHEGIETAVWANGWGAGGVSSGVNADFSTEKQFVNHAIIVCETADIKGDPAPPIAVYFSLVDIPEGVELLVDYGKDYILPSDPSGRELII